MMQESIFSCSRTLEKFRKEPLGRLQEGFCRWLIDQGYTRYTIRKHLFCIFHLNDYLANQGLSDYSHLTQRHIRAFLTGHFGRSKGGKKEQARHLRVTFSINRFTKYLKECRFVKDFSLCQTSPSPLLDGYLQWLKDIKSSAQGTIKLRRTYLTRFLESFDGGLSTERLAHLSPGEVQTFFLEYAKSHGKASRRSMQAALRTFFRFCYAKGYVGRDLSASVPTLRTYKLDTLPRNLTNYEIREILSHIDRETGTGRRDYAIIQLLYTYGIRGGQLRALRLNDIDWRQNQIHFSAMKHGKELYQPLTDDVGESLFSYLRHSRPSTSYRELFLTLRAPYRPLKYSTTLSEIIANRMKSAGLEATRCGSHAFRHSFATRMLAGGHPLKSIADMLGHRCIQTTAVYTKVDFQTLNRVPLDWPEVMS
ncbi:MAG: site-specific integrase [Planctomycetota bacterium]|jgi:site-specific recombinase XerD